jgi:hypothetical protein
MNEISNDYKIKNLLYEDLSIITKLFKRCNQDIYPADITDAFILDIFERNFTIVDDDIKIEIKSLLNYYSKKYFFKIKITDFLQITMNSLTYIYDKLEKSICKIYDQVDHTNKGLIFYKEFEDILLKLVEPLNQNKWKIVDFFCKATGSIEKEFISKEEFIKFCLNYKEVFFLLFKEIRSLSEL